MLKRPENLGIIHFIGIGGIGMSGIAEILFQSGYRVQGSDINKSSNTDRLEKLGIKVYIGQKKVNVNKETKSSKTVQEKDREKLEEKFSEKKKKTIN